MQDKENLPPAKQQPISYKESQLESSRRSEQSQEDNSALMISDVNAHQLSNIEGLQQADQEEGEMENLLKTGAFTREMMSELRDFGQDGQEGQDGYGAEEQEEHEEEEVIDIDNPDELAKRGLRRIQIEGEDEEYLMDAENNIYDLAGNFIGTTEDGATGAE